MESTLSLNLIAIAGTPCPFQVHTRLAEPSEQVPDSEIQQYKLPTTAGIWSRFWVSITPRTGFESRTLTFMENPLLTNWVLGDTFATKCAKLFPEDHIHYSGRGFYREIAVTTNVHKEGKEEIIFQPYFLKSSGTIGFLVDFHFRRGKDEPFTRRILQLSLSLDSQNRRNASFYADKRAKITGFLRSHFHDLFPLTLPGQASPTEFRRGFSPLRPLALPRKRYIAGNSEEHPGAYVAVRKAGPLHGISKCPPLVFIFREQEREAARHLVRALKGVLPALNFEGFEQMFHTPLVVSDNPIVVQDFSQSHMRAALDSIIKRGQCLPVLILPNDEDEEAYATHKALFTSQGIPTQVCTTGTLSDDYTLKWSVANLALQLFCKAGGQPWKVKSTEGKSLIVGIGQAHKVSIREGKRMVDKFFAFSILTDSSGLFQSIEVLGEDSQEGDYLRQLRSNLQRLLQTQGTRFQKVVLHTTFQLKFDEMRVLEEEVRAAAAANTECMFAVVKVNQHNRFFAFNDSVNSLIPYEGTYAALAKDEFLIWFEGLYPDRPTASKAVPGPTHIKFLRVSDARLMGDPIILQDLMNLSGANWRGFNAKSTPVSVFYCHLVSEFLATFRDMNLPMPSVRDINPWFL